ncbi:MAG TPA: 30S ribosomal protein S20 [Armatimonadetes bacterium]|nr:30S ribosomal protein S20 [Armatimonadota bacterium]
MPKKQSAKKRARQAIKRHARNVAAKTEIKTLVKQVREAIAAGDTAEARKLAAATESKLAKAAKRGIIHGNQASRRAARLHRAADLTDQPAEA